MKIFNLPDLGEGLPDAEIIEWYVAVGDDVKVDQALVSVETAKATIDIPSPYTGKVIKLYGSAHDIIPTGEPLIAFEGDKDEKAIKESATVVGEIEVGNKILHESPTGVQTSKDENTHFKVLPAVRALAHKLGVDLSEVTPTGPRGSITAEDVRHASSHDESTIKILRGVRRAMAISMGQFYTDVVQATIMDDADINHWKEHEDLTLRMIYAIVEACKAEPALNAHYDHESLTCRLFKEVNLGVAVDTQDGLYVPVLRDVVNSRPEDLRAKINDFKLKAKNQSFKQEDLKDSTIALSNYGNLGGRYATPLVVPPKVAIIGVGRVRKEVVVINDRPEVRRMLPISLSFDHRALTGGESARFLAVLIRYLESH
ncbi:MAG: 2-oxo acid dehydrogenase subunit E2 [Spirochaetota bacterium]|nr:2-oxo acid dehydrogenase subunit E2 [Spirochaetota bacterium]